jgi:single-stranded DNA-specific DHH superfamily exonuclease
MAEPEKRSQINIEKSKLSPEYDSWYEATFEDPSMEFRIRSLRDELFGDIVTSSGRKLSEVVVTAEELAEQERHTFTQEDVAKYESKESKKERRRTLDKGALFEPRVVLKDILSPAQREDREEGLNRPSYQRMMEREVIKSLVTAGLSPIEAFSLFAKVTQLANGEEWIDPEEWDGPDRIEKEEVDLKLARIMACKMEVDLEKFVVHKQRVDKINSSAPTYIKTHYQHSVPHSQGGLSQRPIDISSHWFEHTIQAADAGEAFLLLLGKQETGEYSDEKAFKELLNLTFLAYKNHSQAAELLRNSIPLSPSLSTKYIREKRAEVCKEASDILNKTIQLDTNGHLNLLTQEDIANINLLANKISKNRGSLETKKEGEGEGEEEEIKEENILTPEEVTALEKLEMAVELIDRDTAVNKLKMSLDTLKGIGKKSIEKEELENIRGLIKRLEDGWSALYLHNIEENEYKALLSLQEILDEDILLNIVVPTKIKNVRPAWRYRLDLEEMGDILVSPYNDRGLELRMLLDILQEPVFDRVFLTGPPPKRDNFSWEQTMDQFLSDKIYGDLRYVDLLEGIVANSALDHYYKTFGIESRSELLKAMFPEKENEEPPSALQNVDKAAQLVYKALISDHKIATIGDCDQDGFFASINWRWILEHVGAQDIQQKFNTRLEGHAVQPIDLLNLALGGNDLIIINDTGSSEKDIKIFSLIKNGVKSIKDLEFFRDNIENINGFDKFTRHEQRQIKSKLTRFINTHEEGKDINTPLLLTTLFTTGRLIDNPLNEITSQALRSEEILHEIPLELLNKPSKIKEYKALDEFESLARFLEGFKDIKIIVCDHHTPSIAATKYFKNNPDAIMVNPEWVRHGYEEKFIQEMQEALTPEEDGEIDIYKVNEVQRKYTCYPESDIVGTVTAGKVMKRVLQLLTDNEIVKAKETQLYSLERGERLKKYRELAKEVSNVTLYEKEGAQEGLPSYFTFKYGENVRVKLFFGDLWLETNSFEKIKSRVTEVINSLSWRMKEIKKIEDEEEQKKYLFELEKKWPVTIPDKAALLELIHNSSFFFSNNRTVANSFDNESRIKRALEQIEKVYEERIQEVLEKKRLTKGELRFYLDYAGQLPQSFFLLSRDKKKRHIVPYLRTLAQKMEENSDIEAEDNNFTIDLTTKIDELIDEGGNLRDLKSHLFDLIEEGYEKNGGIPINPRTKEVPKERSKVRYEGNKIWEKTINDLLDSGEFTPMILRSIESFLEYGPYGLEFLKLTEATATLGDGGSVGMNNGLENRIIVKSGMEAIEAFADDYWDANEEEKKRLKRIQPEILRLIRTSLRGTHIKSVNWHLSRLLTHGVSAFVNAMYRRGKEERSQRAKEFWTEAADFCIRRSDNDNTRRHRYTLVHAQEVSIERREELFEAIVKELENDHGELNRPIIITKLEGIKYVDPIKGMRGLIAGQLADRYTKPTMVVVEEKAETKDSPGRYSVSFRLPAKGNIATDMVQLQLEMNPVEGIEIKAHGGHPEAAGGTWEVYGGLEKLHTVLDPIFSNFKIENPDAGVINIEEIIEKTLNSLGKGDWEYLKEYKEFINPFDISSIIATSMYKQTNPYGVNMPGLIMEFNDLTVVNKSNGLKNDGDEYCSLRVRDKRDNIKEMRLFKNLADLNEIEKGNTVTLRAQPIMRLRALEEGSLEYTWPLPDNKEERYTVKTVIGQKTKPHLDIDRFISVDEGDYEY